MTQDEFLLELEETRKKTKTLWFLDEIKEIRAGDDNGYFCPITFLAFHKRQEYQIVGNFRTAGYSLGLNLDDTCLIAEIADNRHCRIPERENLRERLLKAVGLENEKKEGELK